MAGRGGDLVSKYRLMDHVDTGPDEINLFSRSSPMRSPSPRHRQ